jgi:hypothetical protein
MKTIAVVFVMVIAGCNNAPLGVPFDGGGHASVI